MAQAPYCSLMARSTPWKDQYTLLCEKCGYVLEGLDQAGVCPECGVPIEGSLPGSRLGTPYQQKPGLRSLLQTAWLTIHNPKRALEIMSFDRSAPRSPLSPILTYTVVACIALVMLEMFSKPNSMTNFALFFGIMTIIGVLIWSAFFILTIIFAYLLLAIARLLRWRCDTEACWVVAGHAAIGWSFTGFAWVAGWYTDRLIQYLVPTQSDWHLRIQTMTLIDTVILPVFFGGIVLGSLIFAYISYLGLRRCKYANRLRPENSDPGATTRP